MSKPKKNKALLICLLTLREQTCFIWGDKAAALKDGNAEESSRACQPASVLQRWVRGKVSCSEAVPSLALLCQSVCWYRGGSVSGIEIWQKSPCFCMLLAQCSAVSNPVAAECNGAWSLWKCCPCTYSAKFLCMLWWITSKNAESSPALRVWLILCFQSWNQKGWCHDAWGDAALMLQKIFKKKKKSFFFEMLFLHLTHCFPVLWRGLVKKNKLMWYCGRFLKAHGEPIQRKAT